MQTILKKGLQATGTDWETLELVYGWVHQIAVVFDEAQTLRCEERQVRFGLILLHMQEHADQLVSNWKQAVAYFLKVTQSYGPHLFFCYQVPDLPRTNNDLEQAFGQVRFHERRATGRRGALPATMMQTEDGPTEVNLVYNCFVVGGVPSAIGVRASRKLIVDDTSYFLPVCYPLEAGQCF